ncbi:hypothetical protein KIN20_010950 [Parelaphostrongylus tenuis]|uniref:Uncharacterized protein n=1 Tax=Parelaphostrongylus tenuis TaxID=148309 RepID=A0AAD5MAC8_PARTN|nr:hypothetical protein KIN20_010950 [Parelaphostrongylus tenuis]
MEYVLKRLDNIERALERQADRSKQRSRQPKFLHLGKLPYATHVTTIQHAH